MAGKRRPPRSQARFWPDEERGRHQLGFSRAAHHGFREECTHRQDGVSEAPMPFGHAHLGTHGYGVVDRRKVSQATPGVAIPSTQLAMWKQTLTCE